MKLEGHIDHSGEGKIFGWVRDLNSPESRLFVKIKLSSGWQTETIAKLHRPDLEAHGIGDGQYGFEVDVPYSVAHSNDITVSAFESASGYELMQSGKVYKPSYPITHIAGDITGNCNLRCPFCVTDYTLMRGHRSMTQTTFQKCTDLLPLVADGMFWLSCMHEPTIHTQFEDILSTIPKEYASKISFTTNFCKKLSDSILERIASSGYDNIRISIDSVDETRFSELRKGGRLATFLDNLKRFSRYLNESEFPPRVHFISMAFKNNCHEIEKVIRTCTRYIHAHEHEVRFIYYKPHIANWGADHILPLENWQELKNSITNQADMSFVSFADPIPGTHKHFLEKRPTDNYKPEVAVFGGTATPDNYTFNDPIRNQTEVPDEAFPLKLRYDGFFLHEKLPESEFFWNIKDVDADRFTALRSYASNKNQKHWTKF